jgi:predicted permease
MLLTLLGGSLGFLFSLWGVEALVALNRGNIPRWQEISVDGRVMAFTLGVSLLTSLLCGLAPALQSSKVELTAALKEGRTVSTFRWLSLRSLLVVSEVALAMVLLLGAGLLLKSFVLLMDVNLGFRPHNLLTMQVSLPESRYGTPEQRRAFYEHALEQMRALPGVVSAGAISNLPLSGAMTSSSFAIEGRQDAQGKHYPADPRSTSPEYLQTMSIPLLAGRYFTERDRAGAPEVAIIDETLARRYFPNEDPLGKRIAVEGPRWREIVGVVGSIKYQGLDLDNQGQLSFPHAQDPWEGMYRMFVVVRTAGEPIGFVSAVRGAIQRLDNDLPIYRVKTMEQLIADSVAQRRFSMFLLGLFSALAMLLAAVGLYGVLSYSVTERTHEIGVRMAMGARKGDVLRLVVGQGMMQTLTGILIGLAAAPVLTRLMASLLYGVSTTDPATFVVIPLLFVCAALLACYLPARRATKVDPIVTLRYQ